MIDPLRNPIFTLCNQASNNERQVFSYINDFSVDDEVRESGSTLIAIIIILEC